jgi:hypothetical protein
MVVFGSASEASLSHDGGAAWAASSMTVRMLNMGGILPPCSRRVKVLATV